MVSTRSRAGVNKQAEAGPVAPANITLELAAILDGQAKMQHELADLKKHIVDEMEELRLENSRLRQKIEVDPTQKGKGKETSDVTRSPAFHPTKEESGYNPTPHTFTTTQQTVILSTHHTHFHPTLPGNTAAPTPTATLPTTHIPPFPTLIHHPIPPHPLPSTQPKRHHPFMDFIANTTLERYTSETDPDEHLKVYITHVALYTSHDAIFCKAFPTTLKGPVLK